MGCIGAVSIRVGRSKGWWALLINRLSAIKEYNFAHIFEPVFQIEDYLCIESQTFS